MPNAANTAEVVRRLADAAPSGITVTGQHRSYGVHRGAGPALGRRARHARPARRTRLHGLLRRDFRRRAGTGVPHRLHRRARLRAHPGLGLPRRRCGTRSSSAAASFGGLPAGLGARDTLRTEAGYPLHGQDLSLDITPVQARSGWAVGLEEGRVLGTGGADRGEGGRAAPAAVGPRVARPRHPARAHDRAQRGRRVDRRGDQRDVLADAAQGHRARPARHGRRRRPRATRSTIDVRGRTSAVRVVRPPFVELHVR